MDHSWKLDESLANARTTTYRRCTFHVLDPTEPDDSPAAAADVTDDEIVRTSLRAPWPV